ncbi:MAG: 30S ribosome-binding factor RbfA [Chthonomonadales bacterium]|nr:30S ribosome-binding factor RbfA [Chthonomonadales bacterium]
MSTVRQEQIARLMVEEISAMLLRDLKDPRLSMVTITHAEISRDLRHARVYVSVMEPDRQQEALDGLRSASGYIRGEFTRRARLRIAPEIDFRPDKGIEHGARIFELLKEIEAESRTDSPVDS